MCARFCKGMVACFHATEIERLTSLYYMIPAATNNLTCESNSLENSICGNSIVTHLPLVLHIGISEAGQHCFRYWLVAYSAPSHYLNKCWVIVNWTLRNKLQWNLNQNTKLFIHQNASSNIVCEMAAILFRGRWVKVPQVTGGALFVVRFYLHLLHHWPPGKLLLKLFPPNLSD